MVPIGRLVLSDNWQCPITGQDPVVSLGTDWRPTSKYGQVIANRKNAQESVIKISIYAITQFSKHFFFLNKKDLTFKFYNTEIGANFVFKML